jgi:AAA family ATP:ADP antiporter
LGIGSGVLQLVAGTFLFMKAFDYSLFTASKELLYYPLDTLQKYGAKYVSDMVVYRLSKGLIAVILIKYQDFKFLNIMMGISLFIWFISLIYLFKDPHSTRTSYESVS